MHRPVSYCSRLTLLFLLLSIPATCFSWSAKVVSVADGDTITVIRDGRQVRIRLYGIDTPEKGQDYGQKARDLTASLVAGRIVEVEQKDIDQYGRVVGLVKIDNQNLNEMIIQNGFAWVYRQYCKEKFCSGWIVLEQTARQQKKGMWSSPVVIPPWEWRASKRRGKQEDPQSAATPPEIIMGEKPKTGPNESWFSKLGKTLTPSNTTKSENPGNNGQFRCDGRTHCSQMTSCAEATFFLRNCSGAKMDGNNDGVPCERQWCH
ncbi:MAG: thermonuclease family protein [Desulfobulbus sp.]|nr:thermonuclease family protein [Desulfobulbus sp.]